jgi:hypothetical protein
LTCLLAVACSGGSNNRPTTPATLQIVAPAANAVTGPDVALRVILRKARIIAPTRIGGAVKPGEGHIHVAVDGQVIAMLSGTTQPLTGLAPGTHTAQAEFVAADHLPFSNRVVAAVTFTVR